MSTQALQTLAAGLERRPINPHGPELLDAYAAAYTAAFESGSPVAFGWQINDEGQRELGHCPAAVVGTSAQASFVVSVVATVVPPSGRKRSPGETRFLVELSSRGNPDHGQEPGRKMPGVPDLVVAVCSLADASRMCRLYCEFYNLGGGNWAGGKVTCPPSKAPVARVSYNGRVWGPEPWTPGAVPIAGL
jgi:hypothetical protein